MLVLVFHPFPLTYSPILYNIRKMLKYYVFVLSLLIINNDTRAI